MNLAPSTLKYSLLIVSDISVEKINHTYKTLDLWVKDIEANLQFVSSLCIYCPISNLTIINHAKIPDDVKVITFNEISHKNDLVKLISSYDVIQVNTGRTWHECKNEFQVIKIAKQLNKKTICAVTSDRVQTTIINSKNKSLLRRIKARIIATSTYITAKKLIKSCDGVFLIGHGLKKKYSFNQKNIHIGIASWIDTDDIISPEIFKQKIQGYQNELNLLNLKVCIATRLEEMKGVHIGIKALSLLTTNAISLDIYGEGVEKQSLINLTKNLKVQNNITFLGTVPYGKPFFTTIQQYDLMLLTNLNIEQPRLIFDAISQGLIPICPNSEPYLALNLPEEVLYNHGDYESLAKTINTFRDSKVISKVLNQIFTLTNQFNINSMHKKRADWILNIISNY